MRVAIIGVKGYPYVYGGYDTFIKALAERLVDKGVEVVIYCHRGLFRDRPKEVNGIRLVYVPGIETKSLSQLTHSFLSFWHASFSKADVLFVVNAANGPFGLLPRLLRKPTVINVDGLEWLRPKWKGLGARYFFWASRMAARFYDQIVNDAEEMRRIYLELFRRDSEVIAYGSTIGYSKDPTLIAPWKLKPNDYYLIVGRLIPDNNSDTIISGFLKSSSGRKLVIVGDVPYKDAYASRIKALAKKEDRLIVTGLIKDRDTIAELFLNAYAYFHGHEYGGTNPTLLEALGFGCAVLALDTPFNREVLQNDSYGLYFEKDAESIAGLVEKVEFGPSVTVDLKRKAREGITEKYTWEFVTERYIEVFNRVIASKKPS